MEAQRLFTLHLTDYTQKKLLAQRQTIFAEGDKNGRALAFLSKMETPQTVVAGITVANGDLITHPAEICEQFKCYYTSLYASKLNKSSADISNFLDGVSLFILSSEDSVELDSPISDDEIQGAIGGMAT